MKQVQKIRFRPLYISLGLGLLALVCLISASLFPKAASANSLSMALGAYNCSTVFLSGPQSGQTEQVTLTFNSNGTVSSNVPATGLSGQGYWWVTNEQANYSFRELLPPSYQTLYGITDVQVVHSVTGFQQSGSTISFTSKGYGLTYNTGTFAFPNQTTTKCTHQ